MHPDGHVDSWRSLDEDRMVEIKHCFFFTHDVEKYGRLKEEDSRIGVQAEPSIKDEMMHPTFVPKFSINWNVLWQKNTFLDVSRKSNCLDNSVLESLDFYFC